MFGQNLFGQSQFGALGDTVLWPVWAEIVQVTSKCWITIALRSSMFSDGTDASVLMPSSTLILNSYIYGGPLNLESHTPHDDYDQ